MGTPSKEQRGGTLTEKRRQDNADSTKDKLNATAFSQPLNGQDNNYSIKDNGDAARSTSPFRAVDMGGGKFWYVRSSDKSMPCREFSSFEQLVRHAFSKGATEIAIEGSVKGVYDRTDYNAGLDAAKELGIQWRVLNSRATNSARLDEGLDKDDKTEAHIIYRLAFETRTYFSRTLAHAAPLEDSIASRLKTLNHETSYKAEKKWLKAHGFSEASAFVAILVAARWAIEKSWTRDQFMTECGLFQNRKGNIVSSCFYYHFLKAELKRRGFVVIVKGKKKADMRKRKAVLADINIVHQARSIYKFINLEERHRQDKLYSIKVKSHATEAAPLFYRRTSTNGGINDPISQQSPGNPGPDQFSDECVTSETISALSAPVQQVCHFLNDPIQTIEP